MLGKKSLLQIIKIGYGGAFNHGFNLKDIEKFKLSNSVDRSIFGECVNDPTKMQVKGENEGRIRENCNFLKIPATEQGSILQIYRESLPADNKIKEDIVREKPYMEKVFKVWDGSLMGQLALTSIGISIGHANYKRMIGDFPNLDIWVIS